MNHIPTLTIMFYKDNDSYSYQYDDMNGNTQENGMFLTLNDAIGDAVMVLKKFTFIGIEEV